MNAERVGSIKGNDGFFFSSEWGGAGSQIHCALRWTYCSNESQAGKEHNYLHSENGRALKDICHSDLPKAIKGGRKFHGNLLGYLQTVQVKTRGIFECYLVLLIKTEMHLVQTKKK